MEDAECVDTLAAACAETGDFAHAVAYEKQAMELEKDGKLLRDLQKHSALFAKGKPVRDDQAVR